MALLQLVALQMKVCLHPLNVATMLVYEQLKKEQEESIIEFVKGRDVFVTLPTGFGKPLCYILLSSVFDQLGKVERTSITLVVSPLAALMQDQVAAVTAMGIYQPHSSQTSIQKQQQNSQL